MKRRNESKKDVSLLEQLLDGADVGVRESNNEIAVCDSCGVRLCEGSEATVYASSREEENNWRIIGVYCTNCSKTEIQTPTQNQEEVIAHGHLALLQDAKYQASSLVIADPETLDYADKSKGMVVKSNKVAVTTAPDKDTLTK